MLLTLICFYCQQASRKHATSFNGLLDYLTSPTKHEFHRDLLTVRAIIVWMANHDLDNTKYGHGTLDTPEGYLQLMKEKRATFASFFTTLCRYSIKTSTIVFCFVWSFF